MARAASKPRLSVESAELAFARSDGFCVARCGRKAREWHHVFSQQKWPWLADEPDNVIAVCKLCHEAHTGAWHRLPRRSVRHAEQNLPLDEQMGAYLDRTYGPLA